MRSLYARTFGEIVAPGSTPVGHPSARPDGRIAPPVAALAQAFPWPDVRPTVELTPEHPGWLGAGTDQILARELSADTRLVVELGAWRGMSTRFIADHAPNAVVISVDHWQGSPEHHAGDQFRAVLPTLYESFLAECWAYRDRIIPLRMTSLAGLQEVADRGLDPDLIYIDAEHSYEAVRSELDLSHRLFPRATLVGDDYDWDGVRLAVDEFARRLEHGVERVGTRGWKIARRPSAGAFPAGPPPGRAKAIVLVPHLNAIEPECENALQALERLGVRVLRRRGSSAIDVARNEMASDALHDGFKSIFFIDADIAFDPFDALRLLARPEPVVSGLYAKKSRRELASIFAEGVEEVRFGHESPGLYPLQYVAAGFLRIKTSALRRMIADLSLPLCNQDWGRGCWPFFLPLIVNRPSGHPHYLGEDWAFSHRLRQVGITPMADASIRLWHHGTYGFSWEDAGEERPRHRSYSFRPGRLGLS